MYPTEWFIEKIKQHECLYDLTNTDYKNVFKKNEIWEEIAKDMHLSADICKKRWKGLRDTYQKYIREGKGASGYGAPLTAKKWRYMDAMSFLRKFNSRPTIENVTLVANEDTFLQEDTFPKFQDISTQESDSDECSQNQASSVKLQTRTSLKRKAYDEIANEFKKTMKEYMDAVKEIAFSQCQDEKERTSSYIVMELVEKRMLDAKLSRIQVTSIENKILQLVAEEIQKYKSS